MMKRFFFFLLGVFVMVSAPAQDRAVERTYLSTDKDVYVAGESVWYSAFCFDVAKDRFSSVSSVAYVELHGPDGMVASSKVALENGRGGGRLLLPNTLPTGNYRLIAYTAQNRDEVDYDFEGLAAKTLSVFNVLSNERVADGVEVIDGDAYAQLYAERNPVRPGVTDGALSGSFSVSWTGDGVSVANTTGEALSLSLTVYHDDGFAANGNPGIAQFFEAVHRVGPRTFRGVVPPDYEGEIIRGRIVGFSEAMIPDLIGRYAFISTPSDKSDVYAAAIGEDGLLNFYTGNIYGNKECVCEIEGIDPKLNCHVELSSPFVNAKIAPAAPLALSASLSQALKERSVAMQVEKRFEADTLFEYLYIRDNGLFDESAQIRYVLDDYTRFPTMQEVFVEFIPELRSRRGASGKREVQVRLEENSAGQGFAQEPSLVLLDGVPVFDHDKIMNYDPLLVESINIYPRTYYIGNRVFRGIVNFVTYKRNLPSFTFEGNARVINWQGESYPLAYTCASVAAGDGYPDYRQTIYWHPLLQVPAGENTQVRCKKPDYKGRFIVVAEGVTASGKPVRSAAAFEIR